MSADDKFLEKVLIFVDRNGQVESKNSTPMSCTLHMIYTHKDLKIKMHAYSHGMGNGSCAAKVTYKDQVVYDAGGSFTASPFNTKVKTYKRGEWENLIHV